MFLLYQLTTIWLIIICFHLKSNFTFSFFNKHVFYLSLFLKRKLHIKVIEVIPLIVFFVFVLFCFVLFFFFLCLPRSLSLLFIYFILFHSFYYLFYFILLLYILITDFFFFFLFSSSLLFIFNFPRGWHDCFAVCRTLFSPFIFLSSFILFLPSNPSSSYTYPNSILRLT